MNLDELTLARGPHDARGDALCVMEAVAYIAGEPHSDRPVCVCPIITAFMICWNDSLQSNSERARLLKPLIPLLIGTRTTTDDELTRSWMAFDWLARTQLPVWLRLTPALIAHADALASLPEIGDASVLKAAMPLINSARDTAGDTTGLGAWRAVRAAAGDAASDAANGAIWGTVEADAWDVIGTVARVVSLAAARDATRDAMASAIATLQDSAVELVKRMCAVGRRQEVEP